MVSRSHLSALALALLLLLAGCNGLQFTRQPDTPTATPAPVPEVRTPGELAPGVMTYGVNPRVVVDRHRRSLDGTSYAMLSTLRATAGNETVYRERVARRVGAGGTPLLVVERYHPTLGAADRTGRVLWSDGARTVLQTTYRDRETAVVRLEAATETNPTLAPLLATTFDQISVRRTYRTPDGVVVGGILHDPTVLPVPPDTTAASNASMSARVTEDGYVDRLAVGYDATVDGQRVHVRYKLRVTAVGSTTVRRPTWVDSSSVTEDGDAGGDEDDLETTDEGSGTVVTAARGG